MFSNFNVFSPYSLNKVVCVLILPCTPQIFNHSWVYVVQVRGVAFRHCGLNLNVQA